jgi:hypothetical protein
VNGRLILRFALAGAGVSVIAACGQAATSGSPTQSIGPVQQVAAVAPAAASHTSPNLHVALTIATPDMLGSQNGPAYLPSNLTLPANTDVTITIINFDGATALPAGSEKFLNATGIVGSLDIEPIDTTNPNGDATGPALSGTSIAPDTISHTFTLPALNINVPITAQSRTTFTIHTGAAGTYTWRCMDPCGTGDTGWGGAMAQNGWMQGTLRLV